MKHSNKLLLLFLLSIHSHLGKSQGVKEILNAYWKEIGGKENYDSIKSYHQIINLASNGQEYFVEKYFTRPVKFKDICLDFKKDTLSYYCFDGKTLRSNRQEILSLGPNPYSKRIQDKSLGLLNHVVYFKELTIPNLEDQVPQNSLYNILRTEKDGIEYTFYFDKVSKLLIKEENKLNGNVINLHEFLNYQKFGAIYYPSTIRSTAFNLTIIEKMEKIEFNQKYNDSFFESLN